MTNTQRRLCIVPRWAARQDMEWYSWLCDTDLVRTHFAHVLRPDVDDWKEPAIESWVAALRRVCGDDPAKLAHTYLVGHSVGCLGVVRYLESLPENARVAGCLLVAGWWTLDSPWDSIRPWLHPDHPEARHAPPLAIERVRDACSRFVVLISDNDPFTADFQATRAEWQTRVSADVRVIPGAKHFNATQAPEVLHALPDLLDARPGPPSGALVS